jgi:hypothetical protein
VRLVRVLLSGALAVDPPSSGGGGFAGVHQRLQTTSSPLPHPPLYSTPRRDWGPALGPAGIFDSIYLLSAAPPPPPPGAKKAAATAPAAAEPQQPGSYLQAALIRQYHAGNTITLKVHMVVARPPVAGAAAAAPVEGVASFRLAEFDIDVRKPITAEMSAKACKAPPLGTPGSLECDFFLEATIQKDKAELWWPAGHGAQKLYPSTVTWAPAGAADGCAEEANIYNTDKPTTLTGGTAKYFGCSVAKRQIGLRTIELVTGPLAEGAKELAPGTAVPSGADAEGERGWVGQMAAAGSLPVKPLAAPAVSFSPIWSTTEPSACKIAAQMI